MLHTIGGGHDIHSAYAQVLRIGLCFSNAHFIKLFNTLT